MHRQRLPAGVALSADPLLKASVITRYISECTTLSSVRTGEVNMTQQTSFALFLLDESGVPWFAGAFNEKETAEAKGKASGKQFEIRPAFLES